MVLKQTQQSGNNNNPTAIKKILYVLKQTQQSGNTPSASLIRINSPCFKIDSIVWK